MKKQMDFKKQPHSLPDKKVRDLSYRIFSYKSTKEVMRNYFDACRQKDPRYSKAFFSQRLGGRDSNYVDLLLKKKTQLTRNVLSTLIIMMGLNQQETEYFEILHSLESVPSNDPLNKIYTRRYQAIRKARALKDREEAIKETLGQWFPFVLIEMARMGGARLHASWFKQRLKPPFRDMSLGEVEKALDGLKLAKILRENNGRMEIEPRLENLEFPPDNRTLKAYHTEIFEAAANSLDQPSKDRLIDAFILKMTPEKFQELKKFLATTIKEKAIELDDNTDSATKVVTLTTGLFTVADLRNGS